jgi:hypothetical protein
LERTNAASGDSKPGGGGSMEENRPLWIIATVLFVIAIIGYVLQD